MIHEGAAHGRSQGVRPYETFRSQQHQPAHRDHALLTKSPHLAFEGVLFIWSFENSHVLSPRACSVVFLLMPPLGSWSQWLHPLSALHIIGTPVTPQDFWRLSSAHVFLMLEDSDTGLHWLLLEHSPLFKTQRYCLPQRHLAWPPSCLWHKPSLVCLVVHGPWCPLLNQPSSHMGF